MVILNKGDQVDEGVGRERLEGVNSVVRGLPEVMDTDTTGAGIGTSTAMTVLVISGKFGLGLDRVVHVLADKVEQARVVAKQVEEEKYRYNYQQ